MMNLEGDIMKTERFLIFIILLSLLSGCGIKSDTSSSNEKNDFKKTATDTKAEKEHIIEGSDVAYTDNIIRWAVSDDYILNQKNIREFNRKLLADGYDFNLEIVTVSGLYSQSYDADKFAEASYELALAMSETPEDMELYNSFGGQLDIEDVPEKYREFEYFNLQEEYFADYVQNINALENPPDIVNLSGYIPEYRWKNMIADGYAMQLDDFLDVSSDFKNLYSDKLWRSVSCNDKIYAIPNSYVKTNSIVYSFNRNYISDEQIENFDMNFSSLYDLLQDIEFSENFIPIYCSLPSPEFFSLTLGSELVSGLLFSETDNEVTAFYDNTALIDNFRLLRKYYDNNLFGYDFKLVQSMTYSEDEKPEVDRVNEILEHRNFAVAITYGDYIADGEYLPSEEFSVKRCTPILCNTFSGSTVITSQSEKKQEAFKLLELVYTDEEYQKLIIDIVNDGETIPYEQNTNLVEIGADLFLGIEGHDVNSVKKYYDSTVEESVFIDFCPDYRNYENNILELESFFGENADFWKQGDFDDALKELRSKMESAGIKNVCADVNEQRKQAIK